MYYLLNPDKSVRKVDHDEYLANYEAQERDKIIAQEFIGDYYISTVFLGISFNQDAVFETMVFMKDRGKVDFSGIYQQNYKTYLEAATGHVETVIKLTRNELF